MQTPPDLCALTPWIIPFWRPRTTPPDLKSASPREPLTLAPTDRGHSILPNAKAHFQIGHHPDFCAPPKVRACLSVARGTPRRSPREGACGVLVHSGREAHSLVIRQDGGQLGRNLIAGHPSSLPSHGTSLHSLATTTKMFGGFQAAGGLWVVSKQQGVVDRRSHRPKKAHRSSNRRTTHKPVSALVSVSRRGRRTLEQGGVMGAPLPSCGGLKGF